MNNTITIAVIQFPGSNCERETIMAVERAGMRALPFLWNEPVERLQQADGFIIVGGFSYEDRSRAGVIASLDPVLTVIRAQAKLGKPVLGICNGAQILVETGLVPGVNDDAIAMALTTNRRVADGEVVGTGYYNAWVQVKAAQNNCAFTCALEKGAVLPMPIAHAEGRFMMSDAVLQAIQAHQLITLQYCDAQGKVNDNYPINPNGSLQNIAAVCNVSGNVMAMMPHPERTPLCDAIFVSMKQYISEKRFSHKDNVSLFLPELSIKPLPSQEKQFFVELIITDNHAETVKTALQRMGVRADIKRYVHWQYDSDADVRQALIDSGELFNINKEKFTDTLPQCVEHTYLVRDKDDMVGQQKAETLQHHFNLPQLQSLKHGIVWQISSDTDLDMSAIQHIFFNPNAHDVFAL